MGRRNTYTTVKTNPPRKQKIALKYLSLYSTMKRNQIIEDFWGEMAAVFMTFLTPTQNIDVKVKRMDANGAILEYDDEHIRMLERQLTNKNETKIKKTLLDY